MAKKSIRLEEMERHIEAAAELMGVRISQLDRTQNFFPAHIPVPVPGGLPLPPLILGESDLENQLTHLFKALSFLFLF